FTPPRCFSSIRRRTVPRVSGIASTRRVARCALRSEAASPSERKRIMARLLEKYRNEIVPKMVERFSYPNVNAVPRLDKITVNMGVGKAIENNKRIELAQRHLAVIAGQKPIVTR